MVAALGHVSGIPVERAGTMLFFSRSTFSLNIAPACNGTRSSLAMLLVAVIYAYLVQGRWYQKLTVLAATVPLAYFANFLRLFGIVLFVGLGGPRLARFEPVWDHVLGALVFAMAVVLLFLWARVLKCNRFQEIG